MSDDEQRTTAGDEGDVPPDVVLPIEDALDLHAFAPRDVKSVVEAYLDAAVEAGLREVRLIHGRGIGAQREIVRAVLARHPRVERFADAPPERGGWGATVARLVPSDEADGD
jgi:dsDNA-specific endonuclease/ATPase MutS2